jgi:hypothetical protein
MDRIIKEQLIIESINNNVKVLNEIDFGGKIRSFFNKLSKSDMQKLNIVLTKYIAEQFDGDFGKYLNKYLNKNFGRKVEFVKILVDYREEGKSSVNDMFDKNHIFNMVGNAALDYIEKKIVKRLSFTTITGSKMIDRAYKIHITNLFNQEIVIDNTFKKFSALLDKKLDSAMDSHEFEEIVVSQSENINEGRGVRGINKLKMKYNKTFMGDKLKRMQWKTVDAILIGMPDLNGKYRRVVKEAVFESSLTDISDKASMDLNYKEISKFIAPFVLKKMNSDMIERGQNEDVLVKSFLKNVMFLSTKPRLSEGIFKKLFTDIILAVMSDNRDKKRKSTKS